MTMQRKQSTTSPNKKKSNKGNKTKNNNKKKQSTTQGSSDHLTEFFAQYPRFNYNPTSPSSQEFYRMCNFFRWDREDPEREAAHDGFKTALVRQFNSLYGTEVDDIESWRGLSLALEIYPLPDDLKKAKKVRGSCALCCCCVAISSAEVIRTDYGGFFGVDVLR